MREFIPNGGRGRSQVGVLLLQFMSLTRVCTLNVVVMSCLFLLSVADLPGRAYLAFPFSVKVFFCRLTSVVL
jgi:hypothetical protein